jgi:alpha-glucosidase
MRQPAWWQRGIIYEVYARSFQDSNGDGIGDLEGIRSRLDYLSWLGVDAFWITPIYPSPMKDFGYDIADYCNIDPIFGTLADFDRLIADAHARGLRLVMDFVPNHTSDRHSWFLESRSSRNNPKRDWYIWRDAKPGGSPPNNWLSNFGGSAWEWDENTGQYYYHAFLKEQPDLNWRNPHVCEAMHNVLRFWLDRGVDGFRVDVLWHLMKDPELRDNPPNPGYAHHQPEIEKFLQVHSADHPDILGVVAGLRKVIDSYSDRVLIGEIYLPLERLVAYYGHEEMGGAHLPFNFQLLQTPWSARMIASVVQEYEGRLPEKSWPNWVLGNHDKPRIAARVGVPQARVAAMMLLTLRGTPTLYYGDEVGIAQVMIPPDRVQDPWEHREPGLGLGRDPERTPMPWDAVSHCAGFTTGRPWLPLPPDWETCNVENMRKEESSILSLYRRLIALRRNNKALSLGAYAALQVADGEDVLAYERRFGANCFFIVLNLSASEHMAQSNRFAGSVVELSTYLDREGEKVGPELTLRPNEGVILHAS